MPVEAVSQISFQSNKKFRVPVRITTYDRLGSSLLNFRQLSGNYVKEYSNPKAEELYNKANEAIDWREKARLYSEMGDYELIDISMKAKIKNKLKKFLNMKLP